MKSQSRKGRGATLKNHILVCLDESGSMDIVRDEAIGVFNGGVLATVKEKSKNQETSVSLVTFSNTPKLRYLNANPLTMAPLSRANYRPDNMTALWDGLGLGIEALPHSEDASYLVIVITDGDNNRFIEYDAEKCNSLMNQKLATGRWSFVFQVPPGASKGERGAAYKLLTEKFGVPADNIREWEATREGTIETQVETCSALGNYFEARSRGHKSVTNFFTVDASQLAPRDVKATLDDLSDRFKVFQVPREVSAKEFVEEKTKKPYVIGSMYYQLMKTETIQASKQILLAEKGKKAIYGGQQARDLIGLPGDEAAKVTPGNMAIWDIYVESRSTNRKLVRGTKILVDTQKRKGATPTWETVEN